jgi:hypothetical protein
MGGRILTPNRNAGQVKFPYQRMKERALQSDVLPQQDLIRASVNPTTLSSLLLLLLLQEIVVI